MAPRTAVADSAGIPCRFLVCFGGSSLGRSISGQPGTHDLFVPDTIGAGYDLKTALQPLGDHGVRDDVSVISNLQTPWGPDGAVPAGGRLPMMHHSCYGPILTGTRATAFQPVTASTADQLVGAAVGADSPVGVMAYRVQAEGYAPGVNPNETRMSYRIGAGGMLEPVTPKVSPQLIFQELFSGFVPPNDDGQASAAAELIRNQRSSVLDLVAQDTESLMTRLGQVDRQRMEQHLEHVRDLETRVAGFNGGAAGEGCYMPADPGADPPIGAQGYSEEDARAAIICDLIAMAFTCDISRAGSLMFTFAQCGMNMGPIVGDDSSLHDIGHSADVAGAPGAKLEAMARAQAWHVDHFARLVAKLRETPEVDGSSVLDHCGLVLLFEGGHGLDPQTDSPDSVHSTQNMAALIAGGAGGMQQGRHIVTNQAHPASVTLTAMHAVGVDGPFGEITADIPEVFGA
jgi:hypothetical protein